MVETEVSLLGSVNYIENLFSEYYRELKGEFKLINEKSYTVNHRLAVSTGISLARGGHPVVKLSNKKTFIQFTPSEWSLLWEKENDITSYFKVRGRSPENNHEIEHTLTCDINLTFKVRSSSANAAIVINSCDAKIHLTNHAFKALQRITRPINWRLRRLELSGFSKIYDSVIEHITLLKPDCETIEEFLIKQWDTYNFPSEFHECLQEIMLFYPDRIKMCVGDIRAQTS